MFFDLSTFVHMLILLMLAHFIADYPLQGEFLSRAKNRDNPLPGVPWMQAMAAHCGIHAGLVYLATGSVTLAIVEFASHWLVDHLKCRGELSFAADQFIHTLFKVVYAAALAIVSGVL